MLGADHEETLDAETRALTVCEEEEDEEGEEGDSDRGEERHENALLEHLKSLDIRVLVFSR